MEISAHFDSMLVKLTCRGRTFEAAVARARRSLAEFRIRGVSTNIPFLQAVLEDPDFVAGDISTAFIEQRPELLTTHAPADRGTKLLRWLAEVTVNKPYGEAPTRLDPGVKRPAGVDLTVPSPKGSRQRLLDLGPEGFAADLRSRVGVEVTDTTFRDAHQSLLATRVRTKDLLRIAPYVGRMTSAAAVASSAGAGRRTTWRCGSSPRTRGSGWPRCATTCPGCACRCCCAAATPSATRRTRPRSPPRSWPRRPRWASTSSGSSTR